MKIAIITLSNEGARVAAKLAASCGACDLFLHTSVTEVPWAQSVPFSPAEQPPGERVADVATASRRFDRIIDLTGEIFPLYRSLVYVAPTGVVVRAIAPCLQHKTVDPAVVVVDVGGRWAVSLLGGHEGGANELAMAVANILGAEPVVSTTTEATKDLIVGVGCRRRAAASTIVAAIHEALSRARGNLARVRLLASAQVKADEPGLAEAARQLGLPLRLISSEEIRQTTRAFEHSDFVREKVDLPAVAEPAALLAGRRTRLILPKQILHGVTIAIAQESCVPM